MSATIDLTGDKAVLRALRDLPERPARRVLRSALAAGGRVMAKAARAKCPTETGTLKKSIGQRVWTSKDKRGVGVTVGPRKGFRRPVSRVGGKLKAGKRGAAGAKQRDPVKYAHLVEFGTERAPAKAFMRPAFDTTRSGVKSATMTKVAAGIEREAAKLAAKGGR